MNFDEDAMMAAVDLIGRTGAGEMEFGYLEDDVPVEAARWWARARYGGEMVVVEEHRGPIEALEALARRLLTGAMCNHCKQPVQLRDGVPGCRWTRVGKSWERGCEKRNRTARRKARRRG